MELYYLTYRIVFYEDSKGYSELYQDLIKLTEKAVKNKDIRIQLKQINYYIELLKNQGTKLPVTIAKHLQNGIWELRPGNNRILYFCFQEETFVLLHMFRKKTQKNPPSGIEKAKKECRDYIIRKGNKQL